jgi:hypothetical protein
MILYLQDGDTLKLPAWVSDDERLIGVLEQHLQG